MNSNNNYFYDSFLCELQSDEIGGYDDHYTIYDAWLDYERTLNQQAEWISYYVDCDDGTYGDEIYIMKK